MTLAFYPFYWRDYFAKTMNLTQGQHGAYDLLLGYCYLNGSPVPEAEIYSIGKALLPGERENVDFVLQKYFKKTPRGFVNSKAVEVMADSSRKHKNRVNAGKKPKKPQEQSESNALAKPRQRPNNHNHNHNHNQSSIKKKINKEKGKGNGPLKVGDKFVVLEGSGAWKLWEQYRGKKSPVSDIRLDDGEIVRGWYFMSALPPVKKEKEKA